MKAYIITMVTITMILALTILNFDVIYSVVTGAHFIGHFENQMFFDNGREIYVAELHPYIKGWF